MCHDSCPYSKNCNDYTEDAFACNNDEYYECGYYKRGKYPKKK